MMIVMIPLSLSSPFLMYEPFDHKHNNIIDSNDNKNDDNDDT